MQGTIEDRLSQFSEANGMIYGNEGSCLQDIFQHKRVIEIGAYEGYSTLLIGQVAKEVLSIDTFMADNIPGNLRGQSTLNAYIENKPSNAKFIVGNSHVYGTYNRVQKQWYNGLFIDGDHSYDGCMKDLTIYIPLLTPNAVVCLHDFSPRQFPGVMAAAVNYFKRLPDKITGSVAVYYL